jgi:hypothetical protein
MTFVSVNATVARMMTDSKEVMAVRLIALVVVIVIVIGMTLFPL